MFLSEYLKLDNVPSEPDLFSELMRVGDIPIFNVQNIATMNRMLIMNHGDKTVSRKVQILTKGELAEMLILQHGDNWKRIIDVSANGLNLGSSSTHTITETITESEKRKNTREDLNKVSAYNTDELITNDGMNSINDEDTTGDKTRILTDEKTDFRTLYNNLSLSIKNNINDIIITDISNFITIPIYA